MAYPLNLITDTQAPKGVVVSNAGTMTADTNWTDFQWMPVGLVWRFRAVKLHVISGASLDGNQTFRLRTLNTSNGSYGSLVTVPAATTFTQSGGFPDNKTFIHHTNSELAGYIDLYNGSSTITTSSNLVVTLASRHPATVDNNDTRFPSEVRGKALAVQTAGLAAGDSVTFSVEVVYEAFGDLW